MQTRAPRMYGIRAVEMKIGRPWFKGLLLVVLMIAASPACTLHDPWEDARIESEIKAKLVEQKNANLTRLGVVSREAVVYLSGKVASAEEKALAEGVAKGVSGVRRLVSTLEISPQGKTSSAAPETSTAARDR